MNEKNDLMIELIDVLSNYVKLLGSEINETSTIAYIHGWRSSRYEEGKILRDKIKEISQKL